ncbi:MAG: PilZ domain-containing protein [Bdellovibrionales bacterium]
MFSTFFAGLKADNTNEQYSTRRRFSRRDCDHSVVIINNQVYPVENWSMGGVAINCDTRPFGVNTSVDLTMKFKLSEHVLKLPHTARIVRKSNHSVAFEFEPLTQRVRRGLQSVIDDYVTSRFAESQATH